MHSVGVGWPYCTQTIEGRGTSHEQRHRWGDAFSISLFLPLGTNAGCPEASLACRTRLAEYEQEFRELKNQEVTIESLRLTVQQYREQLEEGIRKGAERGGSLPREGRGGEPAL
jgi:hypothetical protein